MTASGTYASEVEICAMARHLNIYIFVYTNEQLCWLKFPPSNTDTAIMNIYLELKKCPLKLQCATILNLF